MRPVAEKNNIIYFPYAFPKELYAPPASNAILVAQQVLAGQFWAAHGLQCSDMTSLIGNNVAGMVFDAARQDRVSRSG